MKLLSVLMLLVLLTSCGSPLQVDGKTYECLGVHERSEKLSNLEYEIVTGNIVLDIVFSETIVVPAILLLTEFECPVKVK